VLYPEGFEIMQACQNPTHGNELTGYL
jgi:hypothetical protein